MSFDPIYRVPEEPQPPAQAEAAEAQSLVQARNCPFAPDAHKGDSEAVIDSSKACWKHHAVPCMLCDAPQYLVILDTLSLSGTSTGGSHGD